jgi:Secretion system C-terminal sorting domain
MKNAYLEATRLTTQRVIRNLLMMLLTFLVTNASAQEYYYRSWIQTGGNAAPQNLINRIVSAQGANGTTYVASSIRNLSNTHSVQINAYQSNGQLLWTQDYTLNLSGDAYVGGITVDNSNSVYITGSAFNGNTNGYDYYVAKYNSSGTLQWQNIHNGAANSYDGGTSIVVYGTSLIVTGASTVSPLNMDIMTRCYKTNGNVVWSKFWNNASLTDVGTSIVTNGSTVTVSGISQTTINTWEYATLTYELTTSNLLASNITNQQGTTIQQVTSGVQDAAGNLYVCGAMGANGQGLNVKVIKFNPQLQIVWTATWNSTFNKDDVARNLLVDVSGNVYLAGYTTTNTNNTRDALLLKYNASGQLSWVRTYDRENDNDEFADLKLSQTGNIIAGGYMTRKANRDVFVGTYTPNGTLVNSPPAIWSDLYNGDANKHDEVQQISVDALGNITLGGLVDGTTPGNGQVLVMKYNQHSLVMPNDEVSSQLIENRGQLLNTNNQQVTDVRYYSKNTYPNTYIRDGSVSYVFSHIDTSANGLDTMVRVDLSFPNTNSTAPQRLNPLEEQEAHHNYYLGHIPTGRERVPLVNKALQPNIYPNIDIVYGQGDEGLFLRWVCKPGSDPGLIKLKFTGHTNIVLLSDGSLKVSTLLEPLILPAPTATFKDASGTETNAPWAPAFVVGANGTVSLSTGTVPVGSSLIIKSGQGRGRRGTCDFYWSTYFGDVSSESISGSDVDGDGNMYFSGSTRSLDFPVTLFAADDQLDGDIDAFASCFLQPHLRKWITFYGGSNTGETGTEYETAFSVAAIGGSNGFTYIIGRTSSADFPLMSGSGYYDAATLGPASTWDSRGFLVKFLNLDGTAYWATFVGDPARSFDAATSLHIGTNGNVFVGGYSFNNSGPSVSSFPIETPSGAFSQTSGNCYIMEFSGSDELIWSSKIGNEASPYSASIPVAINDISSNNNNIVITGTLFADTNTDFIPNGVNSMPFISGGSFDAGDAFLMIFKKSSRTLLWSTFLGGSLLELPNSVVCTPQGRIIVTGTTFSSNFPIIPSGDQNDPLINDNSFNGERDIFIAEFFLIDNDIYDMAWSRYLGGPGFDTQPYLSIGDESGSSGNATNINGNEVLITGQIDPGFVPIQWNMECPFYYSSANRGIGTFGSDALIMSIKNRKTQYSTFWGGARSANVSKDWGSTINHGKNENGENFLLIGGFTNASATGIDIPVCRESTDPLAYYEPSMLGGGDCFISKIYPNMCDNINTNEADDQLHDLHLFPNPTSGLITITTNELKSDNFTVVISDVMGRIVLKRTYLSYSEGSLELDVSILHDGIYFMQLWDRSGMIKTGQFSKFRE